MIVTTQMIIDSLNGEYANPKCKIARLVRDGKYTQIIRGLYETDPNTDGHLLASVIYSPSYLSFDYALYIHGLIPERVMTYTSATSGKHKTKRYNTHFGLFTYQDIPMSAFNNGLTLHIQNDYTYWLATPEKAMCDKMYSLPPIKKESDMEQLLLEDLRIYWDGISDMNINELRSLSELYRSRNVKMFCEYMNQVLA